MRIRILAVLGVLSVVASSLGQKPRSDKEWNMISAIQDTEDPLTKVEAIHELLVTFEDTAFKEWANQTAMMAYRDLDDLENMFVYGQETLAVNPENVDALTTLAYAIPTQIKEFDVDKEERLTQATDFAHRALRIIPTLEKPRGVRISDEEWLNEKKDMIASANDALGLVAFTREDFATAEQAFQKSLEVAHTPDATTFYHYARTLHERSADDQAMEMIEKSIALGGVVVGRIRLATNLRATIIKAKARAMFESKKGTALDFLLSTVSAEPSKEQAPSVEENEGEDHSKTGQDNLDVDPR